ncbi:GNAT family N-acetyltransferase [Halalkalibacter urbisdiaboli]|uniref:GNAT family N-acetyltransferase n=1 Tax=Halalkalibacter urbisdiaboli TaxID=1960589 RepID=UPI001FD9B397|nr:GNAT family N-acetyltransferase [Halalkalibacter urbisdiaboli]
MGIVNIKLCEIMPMKSDLVKLYETTGWNSKNMFTEEEIYRAISNSWYYVSVYHKQQLIGFGRIISDGAYQTFICDVMVSPEFQNQGIGRIIVKTLMNKCQQEGVKWIQLFCAKGKQSFYKKLGFVERDAEAPGMGLFL